MWRVAHFQPLVSTGLELTTDSFLERTSVQKLPREEEIPLRLRGSAARFPSGLTSLVSQAREPLLIFVVF